MLTELCAELRNYFEVPNGRHFGTFVISGGSIEPLDFLQDGQYFRVVGSVFNDGVHKYPANDLTNEVFNGAVWSMAVPPTVIALAAEIKAYNDDPNNAPSGITSESVGGYSVSKATNGHGVAAGWRSVFAEDLNKWGKL